MSDLDITYAIARFRFWRWDTLQIAAHLGVSEAQVYNALARWRDEKYKRKAAA